jgi:hypothetical protein
MTKPKLSRSSALAGGYPRYYTGERCKNGHLADRYTLSGACVECQEGRRAAEVEQYRKAAAEREE